MVVGADVPRSWILADFVLREMVIALAQVNSAVDEHHRLRLRVAVAHGEIVLDPPHVAGAAVIQATRLRDASALRDAMSDCPEADLGVIVSDALHHEVVLPGDRGLDLVSFTPVQVSEKTFDGRGWLLLPNNPAPAAPRPDHVQRPDRGPSVGNFFYRDVDARRANFGIMSGRD
jgi:hypothetical protein